MKKLFFVTGTNACGKSSIAKYLIENSVNEIVEFPEHKTVINIIKDKNLIILGKYSDKTTAGGCDTMKTKAIMQDILRRIWQRDEDVFMEGYLIGTKVWIDDLLVINQNGERDINFVSLDTKLETCFDRITRRSGKQRAELKGNGANVVNKYNSVLKFREWIKANRPQIKIIELNTENQTVEQICNQLLTK